MFCRVAIVLFALGLIANGETYAQSFRKKIIPNISDTLNLDTLSIVPGSVLVKNADDLVYLSQDYEVDYSKALLMWKKRPSVSEVVVSYQVFPLLFSRRYFNKDPKLIGDTAMTNTDQFVYRVSKPENTLFSFNGLNKSGSISRSIGVGNNQDLSVNSNLVLQLSGKLSNDIDITAAISDNNIPLQPDGNTQQINDFDKVFIQLSRKNSSLTAGDFEIRRPDSYFMNFFKRTQGGSVSAQTPLLFLNKGAGGWTSKTNFSAAVAKGRSARNTIQGQEGNQGPYRITGNNGENFIIILSGTERVYLDGVLLTRGQENDYVIDYNTSEITFTPRHIITLNSRISIEFEYSDKNYARSLFYLNQEVSSKKIELKFNFYSEQDNPNQPFLQDLNDPQKQYLKAIGNNISQAFYPNVDTVGFSDSEVRYKQIDTLGAQGVYVYSTNPAKAVYRLGFSYVGSGGGNYKLKTNSAANGRVFEYAAPVAGIKQGDYEPISLLVTPKKQQLATFSVDYKLTKNTFISNELGLSNNDVNLFSPIGNADNKGMAYKFLARNSTPLGKSDRSTLRLITTVNYEFAGDGFKAIERYRPVEFERDFGLVGQNYSATVSSGLQNGAEHLGAFNIGIVKDELHNISYQFSTFIRQGNYRGFKQALAGNYKTGNWRLMYDGNVLTNSFDAFATANQNGRFLRQRADISKTIRGNIIGINLEQERNRTTEDGTGSLNLVSFAFTQYKAYFKTSLAKANRFFAEASRRYDRLPFQNSLVRSSVADNYTASLDLSKNPNSIFTLTSTYREVNYSAHISKQRENNLIGRAEYTGNFLKNFAALNTYYEIGTGQEPKREFTYLEVQPGQGVYTWNDYNGNGVKELNEFEISRFADQARYIRIYNQTNEFTQTNFTGINSSIRLTPAFIVSDKRNLLARFSSQTSFKIDRKILPVGGLKGYDPFNTSIDADDLISLNSYVRNTLFFNRTDPVYGIDLNYQNTGSRLLLISGFDSRKRTETGIRLRYNPARKTNLVIEGKNGFKRFGSELFAERNYDIRFVELVPEINYNFNNDVRLTFSGGYVSQKNSAIYGGESTSNLRLTAETRYNVLKKGVLTAKVNLINNKFSGLPNSPVAYEMLEGLQPGNNLTWTAGLQRTVASGIQINLNYEGRKSPEVKTIHTGGVQVRAFF